MKSFRFVWLMLGFAVVVLAAGIPFWRLSYQQANHGDFAIVPGALLLGFVTTVLVLAEVASVKRTAATMLLCVPAIDVVAIIKDTASDPTSHNLAPFELVIFAISGALVVVPALLIGLTIRWIVARAG